MNKTSLLVLIMAVQIFSASAQLYDGYVLYSRNNSTSTYLIDVNETVVHSWTSGNGGYSSYLLEDGTLLRTALYQNGSMNGGGSQGRVQKINWDNSIAWQFNYSSSTYQAHHDIEPMPNGNVLIVAWEYKTAAQALQAGRSSGVVMWPDHIVEVQPTGTNSGQIVWEWHAWDHLIQDYDPTKDNYGVVANHPELLDVNLGSMSGGPGGGGDWMHINGISYNAEYDEIVISSHTLDEFYVIDHSTTTQEAAGHTGGNSGKGGDFLYRWGKPANYDAPGSSYFDVVHCSAWVPSGCPGAGNILAFNNNEGSHQSVVAEINPPRDAEGNYTLTPGSAWAPATPFWTYSGGTSFYSNHLGSCQRLPNGNTLIAESTSGYLFEVNASGTVLWDYDTSYEISRCLKYAPDYPGLMELFPTGFVSGTIRDLATDLPIADAEIALGAYGTVSSAAGEFTIELPTGTYQLSCQHPDYEPYTHASNITVTNSQTTTVAVLMTPAAATGLVSGTIRDITTDLPIAEVEIVLGEHETVSSAAGEFSIALPAGTYQLSCQHPDYEPYTHAPDIVVDISQTVTVDVLMTPSTVSVPEETPVPALQLTNHPNPFNPETTIRFSLSAPGNVALNIYNLQGQRIRTLANGFLPASDHSVVWNGTNDSGNEIASGVYFIRLTAGGSTAIRKISLVK
jgi:hypothetical protein